tara:strand:+ start:606 stop:1223 length:618 start_codon:yes stop_codon:yes gene_type:complete
MKDIIPNNIIQIFLGEQDVIDDFPTFKHNRLLWIDYAKKYGFNYIFIDKFNIKEYLGDHADFYYDMRYTWNRIDFARYLVLNKIGGIYCDLDLVPNDEMNLMDLCDETIILNKWFDPKKNKYELNNALMGIRPDYFTSLIKYSIDEYKKRSDNLTYKCWKMRFMMHTTGTRMFKRWCIQKKYRYTDSIHNYITDQQYCSWVKGFH